MLAMQSATMFGTKQSVNDDTIQDKAQNTVKGKEEIPINVESNKEKDNKK